MTQKTQIGIYYPELLETEKFDEFFKNADVVNFNDFEKAREFLKHNRDWQFYTEIESERDEPIIHDDGYEEWTEYYMDRGNHLCNITGNYTIVKDPRFIPTQYIGLDQ